MSYEGVARRGGGGGDRAGAGERRRRRDRLGVETRGRRRRLLLLFGRLNQRLWHITPFPSPNAPHQRHQPHPAAPQPRTCCCASHAAPGHRLARASASTRRLWLTASNTANLEAAVSARSCSSRRCWGCVRVRVCVWLRGRGWEGSRRQAG